MALKIGTRIGPYEITAPVGAGGMGEVYRATDTRLERDVAIKVLPEDVSRDGDRLARFEREAKVLASLNHPNIGGIHGLEEADGLTALVLEFVEGPDLADRIAEGPMLLDEVLPIARQIAEALEAAHGQGIIHRDLKPSNVKVKHDGAVKVLDFGLAKTFQPETNQVVPSNSPTLTAATQMGVVLGTAGYMAPEQARGRPVDKRVDIWAFGATLYEMLTGRRAFGGNTVTEVLARILEREPDWERLPSPLPDQLRDLLQRTLRKDRELRLQSIGDARIAIVEALGAPHYGSEPSARPRHGSFAVAAVIVVVAVVAALAGAWWGSKGQATGDSPPRSGPILSEIRLPADAPVALGVTHNFDPTLIAVSPDGSSLVYVGKRGDGRSQLFLRKMADLEVTPIEGTEDAIHPFFSPDGEWLGFLTKDRVRKLSLRGAGVFTLCQARLPTRATWAENGIIYFIQQEGLILSEVSGDGGEARLIKERLGGLFTQALPDGSAVLLSAPGVVGYEFGQVRLLPLDTLESRVLVENAYDGRYVSSGHLVFARTGTIMAVPFDPDDWTVRGDPVPVLSGVRMESQFGQVQLAVSGDGTVVYSPGADAAIGRIARVARDGTAEQFSMAERVYGAFDLSPDGTRLAVQVLDVNNFVLIYDLDRREGRRLPIPGSAGWPLWSPDGRMIAASVWASGAEPSIEIRSVADRAGPPRAVIEGFGILGDWAPVGDELAFTRFGGGIAFASTQTGEILRELPRSEQVFAALPVFSPDGTWIAYNSDETGRLEIWIRSYPDLERAYQISTDGGLEPFWTASGELFYHLGNRWMSTRIQTGSEPSWEPPRFVLETDYTDTLGVSYGVTADGQHLFVVKSSAPAVTDRLHLISNWFSSLP